MEDTISCQMGERRSEGIHRRDLRRSSRAVVTVRQNRDRMSLSNMSLDSVAEWDQAKEGLAELRKTTNGLVRRLGNLERDSARKGVP